MIYVYIPLIRILPSYRPQCPVVVHASANDEIVAPGPRYA